MLREFKDELIIYLIENEIPYSIPDPDYDAIHIFDKEIFNKKKSDPNNYRKKYLPVLRVSFEMEREFEGHSQYRVYYRRMSWWETKDGIWRIVDKLGNIA